MNNRSCLILSTMRDEGPYILEWVAYHRAIGISDFLVYTNDCRDGTDLLLDRLEKNGILTHVRNKVLNRGPQKSAYKAAMRHPLFTEAKWVLPIDVDEFLNIKIASGQVNDLVNLYPDADVIPVCWRMFSNNKNEQYISGLTLEALTDAEFPDAEPDAVGHYVKSLFMPNPAIERIGAHVPIFKDDFASKVNWGASWCSDGKNDDPGRPKANYGYHIAQINHYAVRAIDPFLLKRDRGDVNFMENRLEIDYWIRWCRGGAEDKSILRHAPSMKKELQILLKDPIVRHLHLGSVEFHKNRILELLNMAEYRELKKKILELSAHEGSVSDMEDTPTINPAASELASKAPGRHKNRLRLLEEIIPKYGRGAEIGVWNGGFSEFILKITQPKELVLIDPWDLLSEESEDRQTHKKHSDTNFMREMYENVTKLYNEFENVKIVKGFSSYVLASYPDDYFDWVYVDGNHLYEFVKLDIELAFKKVKPGGVIAGDDFFWKSDGRMHVKEAVLDAIREHGMTNRPTRFGQQFFFTVP